MICERCNLDLPEKSFPYPDSNLCQRCLRDEKKPTSLSLVSGLLFVCVGAILLALESFYVFGAFAIIYAPVNLYVCYKIALRKIEFKHLSGFLLFLYYLFFTGLLAGILLVTGLYAIMRWRQSTGRTMTVEENVAP